MSTHELKIWPEVFEVTRVGHKTHEFRKADRNFTVGDVLLLKEWIPALSITQGKGRYTGRKLRRLITCISRGPDWGIPEGFVVMSIRPCTPVSGETAEEP